MTEFEELLLILGAIYLSESLLWLQLGAVAFVSFVGGRFGAVRHPQFILGRGYGGLTAISPLPLSGVFISQAWPVSISADGAFAFVSQSINPTGEVPHERRFLRFEEMESIESAGKEVLINREVFLRAATPHMASHLAGLLRRLRDAKRTARGEMIEAAIAASLDASAIEARLEEAHADLVSLRLVSTGLVLWVFAALPVIYYYLPIERYLLPWGVGLGWLIVTTLVLFWLAHRRLYPSARGERTSRLILMLFATVVAMRASDFITRELLVNYNPLAVGEVLWRKKRHDRSAEHRPEFTAFARMILLDLHHPKPWSAEGEPAEALSAEAESRARLLRHTERFLAEALPGRDGLLGPPTPDSVESRAYCPRCGNQFVEIGATCSTCAGLPSVPFAADG